MVNGYPLEILQLDLPYPRLTWVGFFGFIATLSNPDGSADHH
jgi:hypothetical protein